LVELLQPGDVLVLNESRVVPARLFGRKMRGTAAVEILLVAPRPDAEDGTWEALVRPGRRLPAGAGVALDGGVRVEVGAPTDDDLRLVRFPVGCDVLEYAREHGHVPLPPYIERADTPLDRERYQTVFATTEGSVAAPTAGLHLDEALLETIEARGVALARVCLHVGPGTFRPVSRRDVERGTLHRERYRVEPHALRTLRDARARGGRIVAVGTTACRTLESISLTREGPLEGQTDLFIQPGYRFRHVDVLVTNFHLPRSSLLMLVAAFAGPRWRRAYATAVEQGYRFYSYGDANWIEPAREGG
jgi:S-adenosylmethionine:tRNA ribosyltransferase-isomerase